MTAIDDLGNSMRDVASSFARGAREFGNDVTESVGSASRDSRRAREFGWVGSDLLVAGLAPTGDVTLSESDGVNIFITKRDVFPAHLRGDDIAPASWNIASDEQAFSPDLPVHRAMLHGYAQRNGLETGKFWASCINTFPQHVMTRAHQGEKCVPVPPALRDELGGGDIPIIDPAIPIRTIDGANQLGSLVFNGADILVIRGEGVFVVAPTVRVAYRKLSTLELASKMGQNMVIGGFAS